MRFVREERKRPTNARDAKREEEKKVSQTSGNLENEPTQVLLFAFFSSSFFCLLVSSPSEVLLFLKKARVFLLLFCAYQTQDIKTPRRFVAIP